MDKLLFPVKLGPPFCIVLALLSGCSYRSIYAESPGKQTLSVGTPKSRVAYLAAAVGAVDGLRAELSARAAYNCSDGYPRVELEVLRIDEHPLGILVAPGGVPLARGSRISVTAQAWVVEQPGAEPTRRSGDLRRSAAYGHAPAAAADSVEREKALRGAARALGQALAARILGLPVATDDAL